MKIRMRQAVAGTHLGDPNGSLPGDVLDVEDGVAFLYVHNGFAELVEGKGKAAEPKVEYAVAPASETAARTTEAPETKRSPGRPRKAQ